MVQRYVTVRAPSGKSVCLPVDINELARAPFVASEANPGSGLAMVLDRDGFNLISFPQRSPTLWPAWMARELVRVLNCDRLKLHV